MMALSAGDRYCPVHGQWMCRCWQFPVAWTVRPFEHNGAVYETLRFDQKPPPQPMADNRKRRRTRTALARRTGR